MANMAKTNPEEKSDLTMEELVSLCKRRGFVFQASEIYGGIAGFWDYGPYGVELVNNIKAAWWKAFIMKRAEIHGLDSAIIQHPKLWEASGHVAGFVDPMVDCKSCKHRFRADHVADLETGNLEELAAALKDKTCPSCGKKGTFTLPRNFNMMLTTHIGPAEDSATIAYLRPETAGGIYINYDNVRETTRSKIPFGIGQIGKSFRNEITPKDFIFRVRELEQMEMQYFIHPDKKDEEYELWREFTWKFFTDSIGLSEKSMRWHEHGDAERAHYALAAHDVQYKFPTMGFKELAGVHNRGDFDLTAHSKASGRDLTYFDEASNTRYTPNVIESATGVGRLAIAAITEAYHEEEVNGEKRVVLKFKPSIAPIKVAVLPLSKKPELSKLARDVFASIAGEYRTDYDETQSIGRRYRRQDEIGTPLCVTVDFDSLEDAAVTIRNRDTLEQVRVKIVDLPSEIPKQLVKF